MYLQNLYNMATRMKLWFKEKAENEKQKKKQQNDKILFKKSKKNHQRYTLLNFGRWFWSGFTSALGELAHENRP